MNDQTKNLIEIFFSATKLIALIVGAVVAYFRLWREEPLKPRIEFDLDCQFSNAQSNQRIAKFTLHAYNKGHVEHTFERISLNVRGIKSDTTLTCRNDMRLEFPESLLKTEVIPKNFGYFFVRPGVNQQITFTSLIPDDIRFVLARAAFKYVQSDDLHTTENVFEVMPTAMLATSQPL